MQRGIMGFEIRKFPMPEATASRQTYVCGGASLQKVPYRQTCQIASRFSVKPAPPSLYGYTRVRNGEHSRHSGSCGCSQGTDADRCCYDCNGGMPKSLRCSIKNVQAYVDGCGLARAHREHIEDEEDIANVKLSHVTQTLIVEAVNNLPDHPDHGPPHKMSSLDMPDHGMMLKSWLTSYSMPHVLMRHRDDDCVPVECSRMVAWRILRWR